MTKKLKRILYYLVYKGAFFVLNIIYIDVLLVVNLIIDYFLIKATEFFTGSNTSKVRVLLGSCFAASTSLLILLPNLGTFSILIKIAMAVLISLITFGFKGVRAFLKNTVYYFIVSFLFAGLILIINISFSPNSLATNNLTFYFDISPIFLILSVLVFYMLLSLLELFFKKPYEKPDLVEVELSILNNKQHFKAFVDTGNKLQDPCLGKPVMIAKKELAEKLMPKHLAVDVINSNIDAFEQRSQNDINVRIIPYSALGKSGVLLGVVADYCLILGKKVNKIYSPVVAFSDIPETDFNNSAIIGTDFFN